jgi:integral membrane protein (TIGR01906 family)
MTDKARETASVKLPFLVITAQWAAALFIPFALSFTAVTSLISPGYPQFEYNHPHFPADEYGPSQAQRLDLALVGVAYLQSWQPAEEVIYNLEGQFLPGTEQPLYSPAEISHMLDVKHLTDRIRVLGMVASVLCLIPLILLLARPHTRPMAYQAIKRGGFITVALLTLIALFFLFAWPVFFVQFHELLFPPGTWTFDRSSGLIRLFPEVFWFDFGITLSIRILIQGLAVALIGVLLERIGRRHQNTFILHTATR